MNKRAVMVAGVLGVVVTCRELMLQEQFWFQEQALETGKVYSTQFDGYHNLNVSDKCNLNKPTMLPYKVHHEKLEIRCSIIPMLPSIGFNPFKKVVTYSYKDHPLVMMEFYYPLVN
ncbi:hypothetical protein [Photobacterium leiognathi]|uniref:hypothetical protein n=1 Tax=Photobacterium leiognathi TaxID=553611 RepID=UPI0029817DEF|nr:hypothetical protein [Photobacterium leiognathi]